MVLKQLLGDGNSTMHGMLEIGKLILVARYYGMHKTRMKLEFMPLSLATRFCDLAVFE